MNNEILEKGDPIVVVNGKHYHILGQIILVTDTTYHVSLGEIGTVIYDHSDVQLFIGNIVGHEYRKELTDDEIDCMFAYIEQNNLDENIGLTLAENDPKIFISNVNKAIDYLAFHNLLNEAIK